MKYAVLGAGALGSAIGGLMARGGLDVALWDINASHVAAIRERGLRLDLPGGTETLRLPACRPEDGGPVDVVLLLTKTLHTKAALAPILPRLASDTAIISLQNGLGNARRLAEIVPADQVFYGCVMMPARFLGPGHVASQGEGKALFRALTDTGAQAAPGFAQATADFALIHDQTGTDAVVWQKAAFNCAMNGISALQGGQVSDIADSDAAVALARDAAAEVVAVARAIGVEAELDAVFAQMDRALARHRAHKPSMLQDIEAGRATEIDALCGEVVRQAQALRVPVPINRTLAVLIGQKTNVLKGEAA